MTRQAQVGIFALIALTALFVMAFYLADLPSRLGGYKVGVHFHDAAGLRGGAQVLESGVNVGTVDSVQLLPDFSVSVILAIRGSVDIPSNSRFIIQAPLTGEPTLVIAPPAPVREQPGRGPAPLPSAIAILPREILPVDQQPQGTNPVTLADLLEQGQGQMAQLSNLLTTLNQRGPALLGSLQSTLDNANHLTVQANQAFQQFTQQASSLAGNLQGPLMNSVNNVNELTNSFKTLAAQDTPRLNALLTSLQSSAVGLNDTVDQFRDLAKNPSLRQSLIGTVQNFQKTTATIAQITQDLQDVSGNPQTKAQLRDTVAQLDAAGQKTNSLLAMLGAKSSVYGVDPGATPIPLGTAGPNGTLPGTTGPNGIPPASGKGSSTGTSAGPGNIGANLKAKIADLTRNLVAVDLRVSTLSAYQPGTFLNPTNSSPLLATTDRGPQTDINLILFPQGKTSLMAGANDIGQRTTANFAALGRVAPGISVGGGVLYSRLGLIGKAEAGPLGLDGLIYDPRHPTLDAYGSFRLIRGLRAFGGERDITHSGRRTVFGLNARF